MADAVALVDAGCFSIVLEAVPDEVARLVTEAVPVPTIGIGAGRWCDGQVLVFHDLVGLFSGFTPTFVKRYTEAGEAMRDAVKQYAQEVRSGAFPGERHSFAIKDEVVKRLYGFSAPE